MNNINLIGRLTKDPELKIVDTEKDKKVASFYLAVDRPYKKDGNRVTDFMLINAWGRNAVLAKKHLKKGDQVGIIGRSEMDYYEKDGEKHSKNYVSVERFTFLNNGGKKDNEIDEETDVPPNLPEEGFEPLDD